MAVNVISNQLVKLYASEDFNTRNDKCTWDTRTYCQVVRPEQTTMFQVQVTPQTGDDILTNGDFNDATGWSSVNPIWVFYNGQYRGLIGPDIPTASSSQSVAVDASSYYCLEFNIDSIHGDNVCAGVGLSGTPNAGNQNGIIVSEPGTYKLYFKSTIGMITSTSVNVVLSVVPCDAGEFLKEGDFVVWDYIHFTKLTTPVVTIEDLSGVTKRTLTPFAQEQDRINYAIDWFGLTTETSYRVCVTGVDDLDFNFLDYALALGTEGGAAIELEEGGFLKWYG